MTAGVKYRCGMTDMEIRTLQKNDAAALLAFELDNRIWFEQFVLPRPDSVYTQQGIATHIEECLRDYAIGTMHPCVILDDDGCIAGRANLKDIALENGTTEIGYRIARQHVGKGVATMAVDHLKKLAYTQWKLTSLLAFVTTENPASARVLEKSGFVRRELIRNRAALKSQILNCYRYEHVRP